MVEIKPLTKLLGHSGEYWPKVTSSTLYVLAGSHKNQQGPILPTKAEAIS